MPEKKEQLIKIVGADNVFDDPETLDAYSRDESLAPPRRPRLVVKPGNAEQVQAIIKWGNQTSTPLVPASSGGPHFRGDTVPSVGGAVIIDLGRMKRIIRINRRNRMVIIEPGVTFSELQPELAREGLNLSLPLLPRRSKSVLASVLEREPMLVPKYSWELTEPLRGLQVVWANGDQLTTGDAGDHHGELAEQWRQGLAQVCGMGPYQLDYYRLLSAAQGTMGIVTWAAIKCEILPQFHKLFLVIAPKLDDLLAFAYRLLRFRYGDELLFLNKANLASIIGDSPDGIRALKAEMPSWVLILGIAGRDWLPKERVEFQEKDITDIAQQFGLRLQSSIPGISAGELLETLLAPSNDPYWRLRNGGCQDIFFLTTLNRTPEFVKTMYSVAEAWGYPTSEIGIYIQPVVQGVGCHCEFNLPFNRSHQQEVTRIQGLLSAASEALLKQGAFFSRPYSIWADMAYNRDAQSTMILRKIKKIFDPNNVMNPGKLCF